jgi:hypothetical protein
LNARNITLAVVAAMVAATVGAAATWALADDPVSAGADRTPAPEAVVQTSFPDQSSVPDEPELAGLEGASPRPGQVSLLPGPFDDRIQVFALELDRGALTGQVLVTSDVSAVLELQVVAGFYDASGRYVGSGRFIHHEPNHEQGHEEGHGHGGTPDEQVEFRIAVPRADRDVVRAAAVGVPFLVNE